MDNIDLQKLKDLAQKAPEHIYEIYQTLPEVNSRCNIREVVYTPDNNIFEYLCAIQPDVILAIIERTEKLEKEADYLATHALCHSESGRLACPSDFQSISCPPFEAWRAMAIARGWNDVACIIDKAQCMEHGIKCWRTAARKAVEAPHA